MKDEFFFKKHASFNFFNFFIFPNFPNYSYLCNRK